MKISVVIPVFNEVKTILSVVEKITALNLDKEIVIVDDGSTDGTRALLESIKDPDILVFFHEKNAGKGAALKTGFSHVGGDVVIIQDADLEYDPAEYSRLLEPILQGHADVVYGSRLSGGRPQRVYMFWHKLGNNILTLFTNILYNTTLTDMETGYKVFRRTVLQGIDIKSKGFTVEPELTAKVFKKKLRVYELPISYYGRDYTEGKKIKWYHALGAIWALIKYRFVD